MLYLLMSPRFRQPISVLMYQPLKGAAGNSTPPTSKSMADTAGRTYQRRPRSANHL